MQGCDVSCAILFTSKSPSSFQAVEFCLIVLLSQVVVDKAYLISLAWSPTPHVFKAVVDRGHLNFLYLISFLYVCSRQSMCVALIRVVEDNGSL